MLRTGRCFGNGTRRTRKFTGPASRIRPAGVTHQAESEAFFKSIENHLDNNPYRVMFGSGDWTCTIARWKGKMIGPWKGLDGKVHDATGKMFELEFCTVARWQNGEIVEENLFYDQVGFLRQIGVL